MGLFGAEAPRLTLSRRVAWSNPSPVMRSKGLRLRAVGTRWTSVARQERRRRAAKL